MARFHHTVTVRAVDRAWFEECVGLALDAVESTGSRGSEILFPDGRSVGALRLLKGRHLRPGARYEAPLPAASPETTADAGSGAGAGRTGERLLLTIREWRRGSGIAVDQLIESDGMTARLTARLRNPDRPRTLDVTMAVRSPDGSSLRRGSGRARVDLAGWWSAAGIRPGAPPAARAPVTVRAKHLLGRARLTVTPRAAEVGPAEEGAWQLGVTLTVRGRLLMRPVAALALFCCQVPLRRGFRSAVDETAAEWNKALTETPLPSAAEVRAEIIKAMGT